MGRLRTHEDKNVADLAKETVRKWKEDVAAMKKPDHSHKPPTAGGSATTAGTTAASSATKPGSPSLVRKASVVDTPSTANANGVKTEPATAHKVRDAKTDGISKEITRDKTRDSSILLLYNAIVLDSTECKILSSFTS